MADDFIEEAQREAQLRFGRELSAKELADTFKAHDFEARIYHLKNLKKNDEPISSHVGRNEIQDAAKRLTFERALHDVHNNLRRIHR